MTDGTVFMAMRFMLAAVVFVPFLKPQDKQITKAGIEIGAWYALGYIAQVRPCWVPQLVGRAGMCLDAGRGFRV